jgi:glycerophosphoryl diester phosphodiesterase
MDPIDARIAVVRYLRIAQDVGVCALVLAACSSTQRTSASCRASPFRSSPPKVIAHGGGEGLGPSNTLLAMQLSMDAGADILDADLWMTSDGVVVARHDRDLATTTDGSGNIDETSWAQLQLLDTRTHWQGAPIAEPVRVPSLEQILTTFPDVTVSIEIKQNEPSMTSQLCALLTRTNSVDRVYLGANDDRAVIATQAECPGLVGVNTIYLDIGEMRTSNENDASWCAPAPLGQPPYKRGRFSAADVAWSHDHGMAIYTWTVDDPMLLRELAEAGVDGVYTTRPDIARKVFDELSAAG